MKIKLKNLRLLNIDTQIQTTYTDSVWVEDPHNPNGEEGYFADIQKHLERPIPLFRATYSTTTVLNRNSILMDIEERKYAVTAEDRIESLEYHESQSILQPEETMAEIANAFSESN